MNGENDGGTYSKVLGQALDALAFALVLLVEPLGIKLIA